ncbi:MAG TPA: 50S ribosomal protein L7/L12, partial [Clostridiales bacterium]|nr:50S ribosomal protein L7/L12 [Clostridiales bacterium]
AVASAPGAAAEAVVEEKTEFDVELTGYDDATKLKVIKEVKDITGLSLGESKELVVSAPKMVKTGVPKDEAEKIKDQLEAVGAKVTVK